jgi:transposase-like protein
LFCVNATKEESLSKRFFEPMLETEMAHHLGYAKHQKTDDDARLHDSGNARNGSSSKDLTTAQIK